MTLIEGIGDEVTHFFIAVFLVIIATFAWWTTNISEQRHIRTVLLLNRGQRSTRTLTNHTETVTITEGTSPTVDSTSDDVNEASVEESTMETSSSTSKPSEASTSTNPANAETEEIEQNSIIETMDGNTWVLRQRRINFYNNFNTTGSNENVQSTSSATNADNINNETLMEHNYAERDNKIEDVEITNTTHDSGVNARNDKSIKIKLKYINDDLKIVDGKLEERLGDFKKRHFEPEMAANKLIRLIFNGHVLNQDSQTLQSCGFFDNCVVHCLIHPKRNQPVEPNRNNTDNFQLPGSNENQNLNNNQREWDFGNVLFISLGLILLLAWCFRYMYSHLYTITATIGLVIITGIFSVVVIGSRVPDTEAAQITIQATHVETHSQ